MSDGKMKTCATCGNEVREGARFCASCGARLAPPDPQLSSNEPPPPVISSTSKRRLRWVAAGAAVALLVAGGAVAATLSLTGEDGPTQATPTEVGTESSTDTTETDLFGDTTEPDIFGDSTATTDTTDTAGVVGQGVDQTCADLVGFFTVVKEANVGRGGGSVDDVARLAAAASELASKAPAEPAGSFYEGDPKDSLERIAEDYGTYVSVISELDLEPSSDALLEPRISAAFEDLSIQVSVGIGPWMEARCSEDVIAQIAELSS